jgi:type IX secretion system PorP/SprF family membrane protein
MKKEFKIVVSCFLTLVSWLLFLIPSLSFGQDIHFSQFYNSPLNLNPALIGDFNGEFRLVANQRKQWSSVTTPYSTYGVSVDAKQILNTPFSTGLAVYQDKAGDGEYRTLQIALGGTYTIQLKDTAQSLSVGVQPAFTQRSINYANFQFDQQYNGIQYDPNLGNGENFSNDGQTYLNLHGGVSWNYEIAQRRRIGAGIAVHNIIKPQQSFFNEDIPLHQRYTVNINGLVRVSEKVDVLPNINWQKQHQFQELIIGGQGKYHLNHGNYQALYAGVWYRNADAMYFNAGIDYHDFHVGVSYDLNLSSLKVASNRKGGFEFSLIYIIQRYQPDMRRYKYCPDYI